MAIYRLGEQVPVIDSSAFIHPQAVIIGDVTIGPGSSIWPGAVLRADFGSISIGARTSIQDNCVIHANTIVGSEVVVGHLVHLEGCMIEDGVLVGVCSSVLEGAVVRTGAMVAAGAVVTPRMEVPAGMRAQGVPARLVETHFPEAAIRSGAEEYFNLSRRYHREMEQIG